MTCPKCQSEIAKDAKFCPECGSALVGFAPPPEAPAAKKPSFIKNFFQGLVSGIKTQLKIFGIVLAVLILIGGAFFLRSFLTGPEEQSVTETISPTEDNEITLESAKIFVPEGAISSENELTVKIVPSTKLPALPTNDTAVGSAYEVETTATIKSDTPATITLSYDKTQLPRNAEEKNLYLARYDGTEWAPVAGAILDTEAQTIAAAVDQFSIFAILLNPLEFFKTDVIEPVNRFADLPDGIKIALTPLYSQSSIRSGLYWQVSPLTRAASQVLTQANFVNTISGGLIAAVDGGQDAVVGWVVETLIQEIGHDVLAAAAGEESADFVLTLYDTGALGLELYSEGFKAIKDTAMLKVKIAAWILDKEMAYINANVDEAYSKLAGLNLWSAVVSGEPLQIYVIGVQGENLQTGMFNRGLKFYYFNDSTGRWENYANNVKGTKISNVSSTGGEPPEAAIEEEAAEDAWGCQSVDLTDTVTTYTVDKTGNKCSSWSVSKSASKVELACADMSSQCRIHGVKEISTGGADKVTIKADLTLQEPAGLFPAGGVHYADYVDLLVYSQLPDTLSTCGASVGQDEWGTKCYADPSTALMHCGVPKNSTSKTCNFEVQTGGHDKLYLVMAVKDAWAYAKVIGTFSNIQVCR